MTDEEIERLLDPATAHLVAILKMIVDGKATPIIVQTARSLWGFTAAKTKRFMVKANEMLAASGNIPLDQLQQRARARLYGELQTVKAAGAWSAIAPIETVLAKVEGTLAPTQINATVASASIIADVNAKYAALVADLQTALNEHIPDSDTRVAVIRRIRELGQARDELAASQTKALPPGADISLRDLGVDEDDDDSDDVLQ